MNLSDIGAARLSLFLKDIIVDEIFDKFSPVLNRNITAEDIEDFEFDYMPRNETEDLILENISENVIAATCVELACFLNDYIYAKDILRLLGDFQEDGITLKIACAVAGYNISGNSNLILEAFMIIRNILLIKKYSSNIEDIVFQADFTLNYLIESNMYFPSSKLENYVEFHSYCNEYIDLWDNEFDEIFGNIFELNNSLGIVYGEQLSGRKTIIKNFVVNHEYNVMFLDYEYLKNIAHDDFKLGLRNILRDCRLLNSVLCINDADDLETPNILNNILKEYSDFHLPLFITSKNKISLSEINCPCFLFTVPKLSIRQSEKVWQYFSEKSLSEKNCFNEISQSIILPTGQIKNIVCASVNQKIDNNKRKVAERCYDCICNVNFKGVTKIYPKYTWNDLKLPANDLNMLHQICTYARYKNKLMEDWQMGKTYQYGSCVSALFTGPPGTGKTMSAQVIANDLNLALYKVDLSQIVDKYIGETEKHLCEIFDYAENSNAVLFFDEADALIGKRSEITDSKDKYANTQVSYILQKIEEYNGIVLMATNYSNNIDSAITRRIRYVINFLLPDKKIRYEIWNSVLNENLPHKDIDFELLSSDTFEFSGAMIKNIVLNASIMAISENSIITMKQISQSIVMEYKKINRTIIPVELNPFL
jgi:hypothetical protein